MRGATRATVAVMLLVSSVRCCSAAPVLMGLANCTAVGDVCCARVCVSRILRALQANFIASAATVARAAWVLMLDACMHAQVCVLHWPAPLPAAPHAISCGACVLVVLLASLLARCAGAALVGMRVKRSRLAAWPVARGCIHGLFSPTIFSGGWPAAETSGARSNWARPHTTGACALHPGGGNAWRAVVLGAQALAACRVYMLPALALARVK